MRIILIDMMPVIIAVSFLGLMLTIAGRFNPGATFVRTYERVNNQLKVKKGMLNYEKIRKYLIANGVEYHFGKQLDPLKFMMFKFMAMTLLFVVGMSMHAFVAIVFMVIGYFVPSFVIYYINSRDNELMVPQILNVYNILNVQLRAGVHIKNALSESYHGLPKGRFRKGLEELNADIYLKSTLRESVNAFNEKFNNAAIDTLCSLILQVQESGLILELMRDVSEQIKDMKSAQLLRKKEKIERHITMYTLIIVFAVLVIIMYMLLTNGFAVWNNL